MDLTGKVVLITGASRGLGRYLVELFSRAGASVAFCSRRYADLKPIEDALILADRPAMAIPCDVRHEDQVIRMVHRVMQRFNRIDAVINAATIYGRRTLIEQYPSEPWRDVLDTNLTGTFFICREAISCLARSNGGAIINLSNCLAGDARPEWGAFLAAKYGVEGLSRMLAEELRDRKIRVNVVDPSVSRADARNSTLRPGDPRAEIFLWLASDAAADVTGQSLRAAEYVPRESQIQASREPS